MSPTPSGRLSGPDLVLTRTFKAPIDDVWASVTESERTARWFGPWRGEAGPGRTIEIQMVKEEGAPWMAMTIDACDPPHRVALSSELEGGGWHLELALTETDGVTELLFTHRQIDRDQVGEVGPGWEFYLDCLVAAREETPQPDFNDYYPSQKAYFEAQR